MFYPRLLLIGPFVLLTTLAKSAPLPDPSCPSCPRLSPASSLEARAGPSEAEIDDWKRIADDYIKEFTEARDKMVTQGLQYDVPTMSVEQKAAMNQLQQQIQKAGEGSKSIAEILQTVKSGRF